MFYYCVWYDLTWIRRYQVCCVFICKYLSHFSREKMENQCCNFCCQRISKSYRTNSEIHFMKVTSHFSSWCLLLLAKIWKKSPYVPLAKQNLTWTWIKRNEFWEVFVMTENSKIKVAILLHPVLRQGGSIKSHQEAHHVFNSSADFSWVVFTNASVVLKPIALEY